MNIVVVVTTAELDDMQTSTEALKNLIIELLDTPLYDDTLVGFNVQVQEKL